jgi:UDP-N-acetylmuramate dehydrogenase
VNIQENVPLAPLTTLQVGGPARYFVESRTEDDVQRAVAYANEKQLRLFVLGGGSNLVVADTGWPGLVLKVAIGGIFLRPRGRQMFVTAGAGEDWDSFVAQMVARNCAGIECLSGIPGTVGGTPVQNVGAYGQEVRDVIRNVSVLDLTTGETRAIDNAAAGFSYRTSIFNSSERGRYIVLRVMFALTPGGEPHIEYADLKNFFAGRNSRPSLAETRDAVRAIRLSKAMLIVPGDDDSRSAGSFFKNPIVTCEQYEQLCSKAGTAIPSFLAQDGKRKIAAAWLVENSGFHKGFSRGPVGISRKHALAIVNRGGARASEIIALKNDIQSAVEQRFGVHLLPEPVFVGFDE